jgi:hypothetical protein
MYRFKQGIRAAFVNWRTTVADVERAMQEMDLLIRSEPGGMLEEI